MTDAERAREVALHFLDYQARTSAEVRRRLARAGFEEDVIEQVVGDLAQIGLLDDERFSQSWVQDRASRKGYGRNRLASELRIRGVDKETVERAVEGMDPASELAAATELARKRVASADLADPSAKRRVAAYLQRRGYGWETVEAALNQLAEEGSD